MKFRELSCYLVCVAIVVGCGGSTEKVTGTVKLDGTPLPDAEVEFEPKGGGRPSIATTDKDGRFTLQFTRDEEGAMAGDYIVRITTATSEVVPDGEDIEIPEKVPPKYNIESELEVTVESGENDFPFDLESGQ
jgi:hypothetical protein